MESNMINPIIINSPVENEQILTEILNNVDALIYVSDIDTNEILFINDAMKKTFGIDDFKGKLCWQIFQEDFVGACNFCPVYKLKSIEDPAIVWEEHNTVTGRFYKNTDKLINWVNNKIVHVQYSIDITDTKKYTAEIEEKTKQLEDALKIIKNERIEQDERTKIMLDATPLCANFWDENYNNIDCNQEAVNLFELENKQEYLDRFFELSPEYQPCGRTSQEMAQENIEIAFKEGYCKFEWMHQKLNKELVPAEITLVRVKQGDKDVVVGYTRDLREEKKMLAEIKKQDERTKIMLDATPLCANFWDENYNNIDCNQEAVNLFELENKQEYLDRFFELSPEYQPCGRTSQEMAQENIEIAFKEGYCKFEWMHQKLNQNPVPAEITLVRVKQGDKDVVVGYTRDLREEKKMLAEIKKTEDDLIKARDIAEENAKAKTEFLSNMSHELRTPLNAIIGMINIVEKSRDINKINTSMQKLKSASNNLLQTINDILDMSKIEAGKMVLIESEFSIDDIFKSIFDIVEFAMHEKDITIDIDIPTKNNNCFIGDSKRLGQVYMNLLSNAIKFTENGGKISISLKYNELENDKIEIISTITDTGVGIPSDKIPEMFKNFSQVDNSLSRQYTGTGLGLVISKSIVELMHGNITVESEFGVGSTFKFNVILKLAKNKNVINEFLENHNYPSENINNDLSNNKKSENIAEEEKFDFNGKTILLFEDVDINREIVQFLLESTGVSCLEAEDGQIGVKMYNENPLKFDLILMDIQMPNMDGFEATKLIRNSNTPNAQTIPIIAMTANVFANQIKDTLEAGMNSHLGKPINELEMKREIARFLNK